MYVTLRTLLVATVVAVYLHPAWGQSCCQPACPTVCQTVYESRPVTTYRLEYETVFEEREITVQRPVWETEYRERRYTVAKPVLETSEREERYTVMRPVWETSYRDCSYDRVRYVTETEMREQRYVVSRPVWEESFREQRRVVRRPVVETAMQDHRYTTYAPVTTMRTDYVDQGGYVSNWVYRPGVVRNRLGWLDMCGMRHAARDVLRRQLGLEIDVTSHIADWPISLQQLVEVAKALARDARIVIMDEPTSALSEAEAQRLFGIIRQLRGRGVGVIYISHKLEEIYALADRITVLRDGRRIVTARAAELPHEGLIQAMVGRRLEQFIPKQHVLPGREVLRIEGLSVGAGGGARPAVRDVSLRLGAGETGGVAGRIGAGDGGLRGAILWADGRPGPGSVGAGRGGDNTPEWRANACRGRGTA